MFIARAVIFTIILSLFSGCGDFMDDLNPAGVSSGSFIESPATSYSVPNTGGTISDIPTATLSTVTVLYFTMWCPVCDMHMSHMLNYIVPDFLPEVEFYIVDYYAGTVAQAIRNENENGYAGTAFITLADINDNLENFYNGTMGTTVVIDDTGMIRMNEDYKDGTRLRAILTEITTP